MLELALKLANSCFALGLKFHTELMTVLDFLHPANIHRGKQSPCQPPPSAHGTKEWEWHKCWTSVSDALNYSLGSSRKALPGCLCCTFSLGHFLAQCFGRAPVPQPSLSVKSWRSSGSCVCSICSPPPWITCTASIYSRSEFLFLCIIPASRKQNRRRSWWRKMFPQVGFSTEKGANLLPFAVPWDPTVSFQNRPVATLPWPSSCWRPPHHSNEHIQMEPSVFSL